ncbi:MAG: tRNA pseudouridine(55) synthase TruB [Lachnospiraceae bacterium]|nr:tRNA pseudouridine(55) synthase TruB [Lachnospiraceae bacterium]
MINGIINIYKEAGYTSHDVVARLRGIVKQKKIGHTGTLDPDAVGVLPVCFGNATKLCDMLTDKSKEYEACMLLGVTTDTLDMSGQILSENEVLVSEEAVREAVMSFVGGYDQIPPMYSALKVNGKKLYELAREGKEIERKARHVEIPSIEIVSVELPKVVFKVSCSKGTYIRSLCADIGDKLGCGAAMKSLKRTRVGSFKVEAALTLAQIEEAMAKSCIEDYVLASDEVFMDCLGAIVKPEFDKVLANGNKLIFPQLELEENRLVKDGEWIRVYNSQRIFSAVYVYEKAAGCLKPFKMFLT